MCDQEDYKHRNKGAPTVSALRASMRARSLVADGHLAENLDQALSQRDQVAHFILTNIWDKP